MAEKIKNFGGFRLINGSAAGFNLSGLNDKTVIYFVRTSTDDTKDDGFIYFNGKKYGTGKLSSKAVQDELTKLATKVENHIDNANSAVQSVNGQNGPEVTINSSDINLGKEISGHTTADSVTTVLEDIYDKLSQTSSNALTSVSGSTSINVTAKASGSQTISVKAKHLSETEKVAGQIEIITTGTTGIYGLLYFGGDDFEE